MTDERYKCIYEGCKERGTSDLPGDKYVCAEHLKLDKCGCGKPAEGTHNRRPMCLNCFECIKDIEEAAWDHDCEDYNENGVDCSFCGALFE